MVETSTDAAAADTSAVASSASLAAGAPESEPPPLVQQPSEITPERYQSDIAEVKNIGTGSFGCAILVESQSTGERFVAKKISLEHLTADEQVKAQGEASLLKSFHHPNITEYLGSFVIGNTLHIIMEYCSGGSLQQAMARRERASETFDEEEVFDWFLQVRCRSLAKLLHPRRPRRPPSLTPTPTLVGSDRDGARVCSLAPCAAPRHQDFQRLPDET
jgi:hypothetical protein